MQIMLTSTVSMLYNEKTYGLRYVDDQPDGMARVVRRAGLTAKIWSVFPRPDHEPTSITHLLQALH